MTHQFRGIALVAGSAAILAVVAACTAGTQVTLPPPGSVPQNLLIVNHDIAEPAPSANISTTIQYFQKTASGNVAPSATLSNPNLVNVHAIARDASGKLYVGVNDEPACTGSILVFAPFASGNATPIRTIGGTTNTTLDDSIVGIAVDSSGNIYVGQDDGTTTTCQPVNAQIGPRITVFSSTASGDVAPMKTIFTPFGSFDDIHQIALDNSGNIWVAVNHDDSGGNVYEMPNTAGTPAPLKTLTGNNEPWGVAVDATGNVYVADNEGPGLSDDTAQILVYDAGSTTPNAAKTIFGSNTKLCHPHGILLDGGSIYVTNDEQANSALCFDANFLGVLVWNVGDAGNVAPRRVISGSSTGFIQPEGLLTY